ncbi:MAG: hypothetical protein ACI8O8_000776 [Oleiphilaceae bacterium]|jgi:hypothetical protein
MNDDQILECIKDVFAFTCIEFFESLGCQGAELVKTEKADEGDIISSIDAGGEQVELEMGMSLPSSILSMTYPIKSEDTGAITNINEEALEDWACEISNRLMGTLKATLYKHGLDVMIGVPSTAFGVNLDQVVGGRGNPMEFAFDVDGVVLSIHFDVELFKNAINFNPNPVFDENEPDDGELEIF